VIDLAQDRLPDMIMAGDGWVPVLTGFRTWLRFGRLLQEARVWWPGIFPDGEPEGDWHDGALEFYRSPVACPHGGHGRAPSVRAIDLLEDGDYLVGSFQQAYGIDLTDPALDMHWHRFQALLRSLPQDTVMSRIVGWRSWTPSGARRKPDEAARALRDAWSLGPGLRDDGAIAEQQALLGGVAEAFEREMSEHG
jgi:hypothetical protein